ncbi:MAG: hypothetical protein WCP07_04630, partial [bacterium]
TYLLRFYGDGDGDFTRVNLFGSYLHGRESLLGFRLGLNAISQSAKQDTGSPVSCVGSLVGSLR